LAIAGRIRRALLKLEEDFNRLDIFPLTLANLQRGQAFYGRFIFAGGLPAVLKELKDI